MAYEFESNRIPELDTLMNAKLDEIAHCIGRERNLANFETLSEDEQEDLITDAFDMITAWGDGERTYPGSDELLRHLQEYQAYADELALISREADRLSKQMYYGD